MTQIYFMGECMVELRTLPGEQDPQPLLAQSFAGDVYNSAVYLKRCFPEVSSDMITVTGQDKLSMQMLARFENQNLGTDWVFQHPHKSPGLYLIETDATGERHFVYWRSDSAARKIMSFLDDEALQSVAGGDMFFFSGISLAVIEEPAREDFWKKLQLIKESGCRIVFDPNFRERLWSGPEQAKSAFQRAFAISDIVLPGLEDLSKLYAMTTYQQALSFFSEFNIQELVLKNGPESVLTVFEGETTEHRIIPVKNVVDTTSAGDAFNGAYLGARLTGKAIGDAVATAACAAGTVIQFPGAIIPEDDFNTAMSAFL